MLTYSIVVPTYNRAHCIERTISSIFKQTNQDYEIIVVDDGSTDDTEKVINNILKENIEKDKKLIYVKQNNSGGGTARNTGILMATGKYIAFLDSDDEFLPEKLSVFRQYLSDDEKKVLYSPTIVNRGVDKIWVKPERGIREGEDVGEYLFCEDQLIQTSTLVVSTTFARTVLFDPTIKKGQDLDFCVRMYAEGGKFFMIDKPLSVWYDDTEMGRTSYNKGAETSYHWISRNGKYLTKRALYGYKATVLAYNLAKINKFESLSLMLKGWIFGKIRAKIMARQFLRSFLPRSFYRNIVNIFVAKFGKSHV